MAKTGTVTSRSFCRRSLSSPNWTTEPEMHPLDIRRVGHMHNILAIPSMLWPRRLVIIKGSTHLQENTLCVAITRGPDNVGMGTIARTRMMLFLACKTIVDCRRQAANGATISSSTDAACMARHASTDTTLEQGPNRALTMVMHHRGTCTAPMGT